MIDYLILAEKPSAAKNWQKALGGREGTFGNHSFRIVNAFGHLLTLDEPENMVSSDKKDRYASWQVDTMPWNVNDFHWHKIPSASFNPHTKKKGTMKSTIDGIKHSSTDTRAIIIGTDNDPASGEGELLAWEIINAIGWHKQVFRAYFDDESVPALQKAFNNLKDVSDQSHDGDYQKAWVRNRWDFMSMQLTRIATSTARSAGYSTTVVPAGRLKSVMVDQVYQRLLAIKNYHKQPYFEVKYKDELGNVYLRKFKKDDQKSIDGAHFSHQEDAKQDLTHFQDERIIEDRQMIKHKAPDPLLDLSKIDALLSKKGYSSTTIKNVYQVLYENQYLSYPRTEDHFVTTEQFNELNHNADRIAKLVGVDSAILTHRTPRATHVKSSATHGANRPGGKIPNSLQELNKVAGSKNVGTCAQDMYTLIARNSLAMLAEDYEYSSIQGHVEHHEDFTTTLNVPIHLNYRLITGGSGDKTPNSPHALGTKGTPFIDEGVNPKPTQPTKEWLYRRLNSFGKNGVGTGATQQGTMSDITNKRNKSQLMNDTKGKLSLTNTGEVSAVMALDTFIANPNITIQLFDGMSAVGLGKKDPARVLATITQVVNHDKPIMQANVSKLKASVSKPSKTRTASKAASKKAINWNGSKEQIKTSWGTHQFSEQELTDLVAGKEISFKSKGRAIVGKLAYQTYKGHKYLGFIDKKHY